MLVVASAITVAMLLWLVVASCRTGRTRRREALCACGFVLPSLIHLGFFLAAPLAFSLYMALHRWDILSSTRPFVGLANFRSLLAGQHSPDFWCAFLNTGQYALHVPVALAVALAVALVLSRGGRTRAPLQTIFFIPNLCLLTAVAMVWRWIYHPELGLLNSALAALGFEGHIGWLTSPSLIAGVLPLPLLAIMVMAVWTTIGVQAVIFVAGLRSIPEAYYDAARVDGAGTWQTFRHVTLPLLRPTTLFLLVTAVIASFQVFTSIYVMVGRTLLRTHRADVLVYQIYDYAWGTGNDLGLAAALSWLLFLTILGVTAVQFRFVGGEVEYA